MAKLKPKHISWIPLLHLPQWVWRKVILPCLRRLKQGLQFLQRQAALDPALTIVVLLTVLLTTVILVSFIPVAVPFEGMLKVSEIGFTTTRSGQLLLKDVRGIQSITLSGRQLIPLEGTEFKSKEEPRLNGSGRRNIQLLDDSSQWILTSTNSQTPDLSLSDLILARGTRIRELKYSPFSRILSLKIVPPASPSSDRSLIKIEPGFTPLKVTLQGYRLPNLKRQDDAPLNFTFSSSQFELELTQPITLIIQLSQPIQPFWSNIDVQDVKLEKQRQKGDDANASVLQSTILSGTIGMVERQLDLKPRQFLLVNPPGIQTLGYLEIPVPDKSEKSESSSSSQKTDESTNGLTVAISGKTPQIQAGLNNKLPVAPTLQGSFLSRWLPSEAIAALLSFCGGLVASLLMWLIDAFKKQS